MAIFQTYDQNGKKLSFANWISNISPEETPFVSATGKETIDETKFSWQVDSLAKAAAPGNGATYGGNAVFEGSDAVAGDLKHTDEISNVTQILRKVVFVSDTANSTANYGRGRELMYQLEKAGAEIKRDLEVALLQNGPANASAKVADPSNPGASVKVRTTGGFRALVGRTGAAGSETVNQAAHTGVAPDSDFGQVVVQEVTGGALTEEALFKLTQALYIVGAKADTIMVHPKHAGFFSSLQENGAASGQRVRYFENTKTIDLQVSTVVDPLGQTFKIVYNRYMPEDSVFIFNPSDWTQMVLRAPMRTELAKTGSSQKWMIEMEVGLRHRNPYASGVLTVKQ